jgi:hypothetical protein
MRRKRWMLALVLVGAGLVAANQPALAHTSIKVGDYAIEVGWLDEPAVVGERNGIVLMVSNTASPDSPVDISGLRVAASYGGEIKDLMLQPASEESVNEYVAPILPTVEGLYTVQLRGQLGNTEIDEDVQPEEVAAADSLAFPSAGSAGPAPQSPATGTIVGAAGLAVGLIALALSILALRKSR